MRASFRRALPLIAGVLLLLSGSTALAGDQGLPAQEPRVVLMVETVGCRDAFQRLVCDGFRRALRRTGISGRIVTPSPREDPLDTLGLLARQHYDLVVSFGFATYQALGEVAKRNPKKRFAALDAPRRDIAHRPRNVQGIVFRTSEAAFLAGWLAGKLERARPGKDAVGVVPGIPIPSVEDFVIGFKAGVLRASPRARVIVTYSDDFLDASRCKAIARRQIAQGVGVVFNVAGGCGLGTLEAAKDTGIWGVGVDTDQSVLGPHVLTSVLKRFEDGLVALLRQVRTGRVRTGGDTILTLEDRAVGLGRISPKVPRSIRAELARLEARVASGEVRVPGAYGDPRG